MVEPTWTEYGAVGGVLAFAWLIVKEVLGMLQSGRRDSSPVDWNERDFHIRAIVRDEIERAGRERPVE